MSDWIARLFGRQVVFLRDFDGEVTKRWARRTPFGLVCNRFGGRSSRCLLLDDGTVQGPCYVHEWKAAAPTAQGVGE